MKGMRLISAKRRLYKDVSNAKLSKAPKMVSFFMLSSFGHSQIPLLQFTKIGAFDNTSFNMINCQKWDETPYQKHEFLRDCKDNSTSDANIWAPH